MQGLHLTADLSACRSSKHLMTDANALVTALVAAVQANGLQALSQLAYQFPCSPQGPGGVTATVLLAESHACIHTWPEQSAVTVDVYVCNFGGDHSGRAQGLMDALIALFEPQSALRHTLHRGLA